MRAVRIVRAGLLAGVALGALAAATACDPVTMGGSNVNSTPAPAYVICDDTANAAACPDVTANVVVDNAN